MQGTLKRITHHAAKPPRSDSGNKGKQHLCIFRLSRCSCRLHDEVKTLRTNPPWSGAKKRRIDMLLVLLQVVLAHSALYTPHKSGGRNSENSRFRYNIAISDAVTSRKWLNINIANNAPRAESTLHPYYSRFSKGRRLDISQTSSLLLIYY